MGLEHLNAAVQRTAAHPRLDGDDSIRGAAEATSPIVHPRKKKHSFRSASFFCAAMGLERAAPVRTLVKKHAGGMFLARGRVRRYPDASGTDVDECRP